MRTYIGKKKTAIVICVLVLCTLFLSISFLVVEAKHNCTGDGCPICADMELCVQNIGQWGSGMSIGLTPTYVQIYVILLVTSYFYIRKRSTLISYKVRMNN